jgi:hypothetical protein
MFQHKNMDADNYLTFQNINYFHLYVGLNCSMEYHVSLEMKVTKLFVAESSENSWPLSWPIRSPPIMDTKSAASVHNDILLDTLHT